MLQIFFVLRKKNSHISTLHVIHHGVMPMSVWFGVKFTPGKDKAYRLLIMMFFLYICLLNLFINFRWPQYFLWVFEHFCAHRNVYILYACRIRTAHAKIFMVEKVPYYITNGKTIIICKSAPDLI